MKIPPCVVTVTFVDCKELPCRVGMKGYQHHRSFCPQSRSDEYIYVSVESRPLRLSFVHLARPSLLPTARACVSHIDKALTYQPDTPIKGNCEGEASEVTGWGQKTEKNQTPCCCQGAGDRSDLACNVVPLSGTICSHSPELWLFPAARPEAPEMPLAWWEEAALSFLPQKKKSERSACAQQQNGWRHLLNRASSMNLLNKSICLCFQTGISF